MESSKFSTSCLCSVFSKYTVSEIPVEFILRATVGYRWELVAGSCRVFELHYMELAMFTPVQWCTSYDWNSTYVFPHNHLIWLQSSSLNSPPVGAEMMYDIMHKHCSWTAGEGTTGNTVSMAHYYLVLLLGMAEQEQHHSWSSTFSLHS